VIGCQCTQGAQGIQWAIGSAGGTVNAVVIGSQLAQAIGNNSTIEIITAVATQGIQTCSAAGYGAVTITGIVGIQAGGNTSIAVQGKSNAGSAYGWVLANSYMKVSRIS